MSKLQHLPTPNESFCAVAILRWLGYTRLKGSLNAITKKMRLRSENLIRATPTDHDPNKICMLFLFAAFEHNHTSLMMMAFFLSELSRALCKLQDMMDLNPKELGLLLVNRPSKKKQLKNAIFSEIQVLNSLVANMKNGITSFPTVQ